MTRTQCTENKKICILLLLFSACVMRASLKHQIVDHKCCVFSAHCQCLVCIIQSKINIPIICFFCIDIQVYGWSAYQIPVNSVVGNMHQNIQHFVMKKYYNISIHCILDYEQRVTCMQYMLCARSSPHSQFGYKRPFTRKNFIHILINISSNKRS